MISVKKIIAMSLAATLTLCTVATDIETVKASEEQEYEIALDEQEYEIVPEEQEYENVPEVQEYEMAPEEQEYEIAPEAQEYVIAPEEEEYAIDTEEQEPASADNAMGDDELDTKVKEAVEDVNKAIKRLEEKGVLEEAGSWDDIFNSLKGIAQSGKSVIDGGLSFLKIIGVYQDAEDVFKHEVLTKLSEIQNSLAELRGILEVIENKIDGMQLEEELTERVKAAQEAQKEWVDHSEAKMLELDRLAEQYKNGILVNVFNWCEATTPEDRKTEILGNTVDEKKIVDNSQIVVLYTGQGDTRELGFSTKNDVVEKTDDDLSVSEWYVIPAELIPEIPTDEAEFQKNFVNTMKPTVLADLKDASGKITFSNADFRTDFLAKSEAEQEEWVELFLKDAFLTLTNRLSYIYVNNTEGFVADVKSTFNDFVNYMQLTSGGYQSLLHAILYTHNFEDEVSENLSDALSGIQFRTGTYGAFVLDVLGKSVITTKQERLEVVETWANLICDINKTWDEAMSDNASSHCLINDKKIGYNDVNLYTSIKVKFLYECGAWITPDIYTYEGTTDEQTISADYGKGMQSDISELANMTLSNSDIMKIYITYLGMGGEATADAFKNYLAEHVEGFADHKDINSIVGNIERRMGFSTDERVQSTYHNEVVDGYMVGWNGVVYDNSCKLEAGFFHNLDGIFGKVFDFSAPSLNQPKPVFFRTVVGESRHSWVKDEIGYASSGNCTKTCDFEPSILNPYDDTFAQYESYDTIHIFTVADATSKSESIFGQHARLEGDEEIKIPGELDKKINNSYVNIKAWEQDRLNNGVTLNSYLHCEDIEQSDINSYEAKAFNKYLKKLGGGTFKFIRAHLIKSWEQNGASTDYYTEYESAKPIKITRKCVVPKGEQLVGVLCYEPGKDAKLLDATYDKAHGTVTFKTDKFTTFAIVTSSHLDPGKIEKNSQTLSSALKVTQTGSQLNIKWGKVKDADGYRVYASYCGENIGKPVKTISDAKTTTATIKKLNNKKLNLKRHYKIEVQAYKIVNGKKVDYGKSISAHVVGRMNSKETNTKGMKLESKSKLSLLEGKSSQIKVRTSLVDSKKKQIPSSHVKKLRFKTSDKSIATVDAKGKITARKPGSCNIYVYAPNGLAKTIKVTVE